MPKILRGANAIRHSLPELKAAGKAVMANYAKASMAPSSVAKSSSIIPQEDIARAASNPMVTVYGTRYKKKAPSLPTRSRPQEVNLSGVYTVSEDVESTLFK